MRIHKIPHQNGADFTIVYDWGEIEKVNPVEYYRDAFIQIELMQPSLLGIVNDKVIAQASADWDNKVEKMKQNGYPTALLELLDVTSKDQQEKLLKGLPLKNTELHLFILDAWEKKGFTYSKYRASFYPSWVDRNKLPTLFKNEGGNMIVVGDTPYSNSQLNQILLQRTERISHFLDRGDSWHCFFTNYNSLSGRENHKDGQPHLHYISNLWTLKREIVVNELKSRRHKFTTKVHIDYETHRNR